MTTEELERLRDTFKQASAARELYRNRHLEARIIAAASETFYDAALDALMKAEAELQEQEAKQ